MYVKSASFAISLLCGDIAKIFEALKIHVTLVVQSIKKHNKSWKKLKKSERYESVNH